MAITPKLELKQSQSLLMTPQLRQAINLLQLSNLELGALVEEELIANPLLQKEDSNAGNDAEIPQTIDDYDTKENARSTMLRAFSNIEDRDINEYFSTILEPVFPPQTCYRPCCDRVFEQYPCVAIDAGCDRLHRK